MSLSATGKTTTSVEIGGVVYNSVSEAAKAVNVNRHTISRWIKLGRAKKLTKQEKSVIIDGFEYGSISEAAKRIGVSTATIRSMIKHKEATVTSQQFQTNKEQK